MKKNRLVDSDNEYGKIPEGWEMTTIESLLGKVKRLKKIQTTEYCVEGNFPVIDQGKGFIAGYTNDETIVYKEDLIVFGDHTRCFKYANFPFACRANGTQLLITGKPEKMPEILLFFYCKECWFEKL